MVASEERLEWSLGHAYQTLPERLQCRMAAVTLLCKELHLISTIICCVLRRFLSPWLHLMQTISNFYMAMGDLGLLVAISTGALTV